MAELERLREALVELRAELDRSNQSAAEAEALVQLSEALAKAVNRQEALDLLVKQAASIFRAPFVAVVEGAPPTFKVDASVGPIGDYLDIPVDVAAKPRHILDLDKLPNVDSIVSEGLKEQRSFLSVPLAIDGKQQAAIICGHTQARFFTKRHLALLKRISNFASQSLTSLALSSQTHLLSAVIDGSSSSFAIADAKSPSRPLVFVNKAFEDLTGYASEEVLGHNCRLLSAEASGSEERTRLREAVAQNGTGRFLLRNTKKSGEPFWNELTLFPVRNAAGEADYLVATQMDVSERVAAQQEMDRVKEQQAISQLAAGIAHDFNNLLSAINGSALLISTAPDVTTEIDTHASRIAQAGNRAAKLVSRMLDLGSKSDDYHVFDLKLPVLEAVDLARSTIGNAVKLHMKLDPVDCFVRGSTTQVNQIVVNLLLNARDAIGEEIGEIEICLGHEANPTEITDIGKLDPTRRYARLIVNDDGPGMDEFTLGRIFEPYFSTKGRSGKGIGLSMVAKLIGQLGGALKVTSKPGEGSTFTIWLPLVERPEDMVADVEVLSGKTILIVDDEPEAGEVLSSYLARFGAETSVLTMPELAIEILEEDHADWDVVITDYDMPELSGGDLAQKVKKFAPELPIFVVTALARRTSDKRLQEANVKGIFEKPLDLEAFARALAGHLEKSGKTAR